MKLYHKDVFFKPAFHNFIAKNITLKFSKHLIERLIERGIDIKKIPQRISNDPVVVETETTINGDYIVKQLIRYQYSSDYDLVIAVMRDGFVKTAWLNRKTDTHNTLDKSKYSTY